MKEEGEGKGGERGERSASCHWHRALSFSCLMYRCGWVGTEFLQERSNGLSLSANLEGLRVSRSRGLGALKV